MNTVVVYYKGCLIISLSIVQFLITYIMTGYIMYLHSALIAAIFMGKNGLLLNFLTFSMSAHNLRARRVSEVESRKNACFVFNVIRWATPVRLLWCKVGPLPRIWLGGRYRSSLKQKNLKEMQKWFVKW